MAAVAIAASAAVVLARNPIASVLSLLASFFALATGLRESTTPSAAPTANPAITKKRRFATAR